MSFLKNDFLELNFQCGMLLHGCGWYISLLPDCSPALSASVFLKPPNLWILLLLLFLLFFALFNRYKNEFVIALIWIFLGVVIYSYLLLFPDFLITLCCIGGFSHGWLPVADLPTHMLCTRSPRDREVEALGSHPGSASVCLEPVTHPSQRCDFRQGPRLACPFHSHCPWAWTSFLTSSWTCPLVERGAWGQIIVDCQLVWPALLGLRHLDVCPWEQHSEAEGPACRRAQMVMCFVWRKRHVKVPTTECPWASFILRRELSGAFFLIFSMKYHH